MNLFLYLKLFKLLLFVCRSLCFFLLELLLSSLEILLLEAELLLRSRIRFKLLDVLRISLPLVSLVALPKKRLLFYRALLFVIRICMSLEPFLHCCHLIFQLIILGE